jgi:hypothetical protein
MVALHVALDPVRQTYTLGMLARIFGAMRSWGLWTQPLLRLRPTCSCATVQHGASRQSSWAAWISKHLEVSAGVETLILIGLSRPQWNDAGPSSNEDHAVNAATDGYGTFGSEQLTGMTSVAVLPGLGIRYEF